MSKNVEYWEQYKVHVGHSMHDFGVKTPVILTYGLASEITEVFDVTNKELIHNKKLTKERIFEIGDVLWYLAAIEIFYNLPYPRYTNYLGVPFEISNAHGINLVETQSSALYYASEISHAMATGAVDDVQYNLNKVLAAMFDVCMVYGINIVECLQASVNKITMRHPNGFDKDAKKNYADEYKAQKVFIKQAGEEEILFNIKLNKRNKDNPYKLIEVKGFDKIKKFETGDIITDFFNASNFIAKEFKGNLYRINYSPEFRELLDQTVEEIFTGYIVGEDLVSAAEMRKHMEGKSQGKSNTVYVGKETGRPILMTPSLKKLNDLLDYVNTVKEEKN